VGTSLLSSLRDMTSGRCKPILPTLAACFIVVAPCGPAAAGPQGDWVQVIAAAARGDHAQAQRLIRSLAERGDADAQYDLGTIYQAGEDLPPDFVQAYKWYQLAASRFAASEESMRDRAIKNRDRIAAVMTPAQIAEAQRLARVWKPTG
jgi:TPR repeat protein